METAAACALPPDKQVRSVLHALCFRCLGHKVIAVVGIAVTLGLFALVSFYTERQERNILAQNERTMSNLTESVIGSLQTVMLAGYADIAQSFAEKLKTVPEVTDFRILRVDGSEAFRDNRTIDDVNRRRGDEEFLPRESETVVPVLAKTDPTLAAVMATRRVVPFYEQVDGQRVLTFVAPIVTEEKCFKCHGSAEAIRGVVKLSTSLAPVEEDIRATWSQAVLILVLALSAIMVATHQLIKRAVVRPIAALSEAMAQVSSGRLDHAVPVPGRDELGVMANSFNRMTSQLLVTLNSFRSEHDKLTTIILTANEGIVVTDGSGEVVLVNPAAEALLGKPAPRVIAGGFTRLFDDPAIMEARLAEAGLPADVEVGERILSVSANTIHDEHGRALGSTALLRDVTEAKRLEQRLRMLSLTDGLTGLGNRRFLDQSLQTEFDRATAQGLELSLLMFDIDHFKRFNDTHGHDQGDRVLKAVAEATRESVRAVDLPCRYGGEEFVVVLRQTGQPGALVTAERLRRNVEEMVVDGLKVTVTVGVASLREIGAGSAVNLLERADAALYEGKKGGRNRVVTAGDTPAAVAE